MKKKKYKKWKEKMNQQKLEIVREIISKPTTKENLVVFVVLKLYIEYQNRKDGLCLKRHDSS